MRLASLQCPQTPLYLNDIQRRSLAFVDGAPGGTRDVSRRDLAILLKPSRGIRTIERGKREEKGRM